ncbi:ABC transporter ATP-binding protein [Paenibacillus radicis (ex Xue et al. 2023)]|uniref:ABC transporter ATP-binding protein n=1 Tax=Paenibacillus radicis (ex Xue et al. 2023) TaxID=2972489 RepID=A0ABT1YG10_9BACL|nr:ABC transporter ATP-binding protein [Paenibacillus radicis (ex Xue et al. 2023)]MCR8632139.1 ABC transporter ATP-binding protein [Paenibacillus radicis (ex Xue et al. 2023)]
MIEVRNLTKHYGKHVAVDHVSFTIADGEIVGFLGPNGAGKSTTMNIMTGYMASTEGEVIISGHNILDEPEKAKSKIGYLPEQPPLYSDMKVDEYLNFVADIKKVKSSQKKAMIEEIKEMVRITDVSNRLIKNLSKGYKQRVGLAQAMIGNPEIIILDEPTVGLDPKQIIEMRDVIKTLGNKHTVILSSHILSEVSAVCDRVIIINKGKIVTSETPDKLSNNLIQGSKLLSRIKGTEAEIKNAVTSFPLIKHVTIVGSKECDTIDVLFEGDGHTDIRESIFNAMSKSNLPILTQQPLNLSLEEIFLEATGERNNYDKHN